MADIVTTLMTQLSSIGFFEFLLPWLFTFAVVYGLLMKVGVFGDVSKKVSPVIAIVIAFFITPYAGPWLASYFSTLSTEIAIVLAGILTLVLFAGMIGFKADELKSKKWGLPIVVVMAAIVFFFALGGEFTAVTIGENTIMTVVFIAFLIIAVWFITSNGKKEEKTQTGGAS